MKFERIKNISIIVTVLFVIILFFWIARYFGGESAMNEPPQIVCKIVASKEECFLTAHIHAELKLLKNNQELSIGYEKGNLDRNHTHSQKNINHWHGLIGIDPKNKNKKYTFENLTDFADFQIKFIPEDFNWNEKFKAKPKKFMVNGKEVDPSYRWQAKDKIEIHYD
ncbi:MAG: hypothetical protein WDZ41_05745 [Candidatus Babeliales bacterium]